MTQKGGTNHYNIKILKGYGFSIKVKDSKIILKNCSDPFEEPEVEEWLTGGSYEVTVVCSNCGHTVRVKISQGKTVEHWARNTRCKVCKNRGHFQQQSY